ncbi:uncharacterized protein LOC110377753 isoform X1 [Helicoverpa armigera]|uniref:uncharacterized protein LOC110377753 isoform X1 n=1 Tax=Helicoverpa armigera TaxID=29058 RepID=UPI003082D6A9
MAYYSDPASNDEIVLPTTEYTGNKKTNSNDFVEDWVDVTVENAIRRGQRLQKLKPLPDDTDCEYNVADFDFFGSLLKGKRRSRRSKSPYRRPNTNVYAYYSTMSNNVGFNNPQIKNKNLKKCSMRINELAVPSKRQCLDTWRYRSNVLPEFMVVRLKQQVMDQLPIVQIPEALYWFQKRRPRKSYSSKTTLSKSHQKDRNENAYDLRKPLRKMDERTLCILFAHKITKLLLKPLNVTLTPELDAISRVVSSDIAKLLRKCAFSKNLQYLPIQRDVANTITIWIAGILEDLSFKLLEEDLQVTQETEATAKDLVQCVTYMEMSLEREKFTLKDTDLEEEEGPVLDFVDDVIENVLNICEPHPVYVEPEPDTSTISKDDEMLGESEKSTIQVDSTDLEISKLEDVINIDIVEAAKGLIEEFESKDYTLTDLEHFRKEINAIIDYVAKASEDNMSNGSGDDVENMFDKTISPEGETEDVLEGDDLSTDTMKDIQSKVYEEIDENAEVNDANVVDDFEMSTEDDDKDRKVIFSETVDPNDLADQKDTSIDDVFGKSEEEQTQGNALSDKSSVSFSEPNDNLLSQIHESDERQMSPKDAANKTEESKSSDTQIQEEIGVGELNRSSEKHGSESELNKGSSDSKTLGSKQSNESVFKVYNEPEDVQQIMKTGSEIGETISATDGSEGQINEEKPDETKPFDMQLIEKIIDDEMISPLSTEKDDSPTESPRQKMSIEATDVELEEVSERLDITDNESKAVDEPSTEEEYKVIELESVAVETRGAAEGAEIPSPETESQKDRGLSKTDKNVITDKKKQISTKEEPVKIDEQKSFDTQLIEKIIVDKLFRPTEKRDTKKKLKPQQKPVKKTTTSKPKVPAKKIDKKQIESKAPEEVCTIVSLESEPKTQLPLDHGWKVQLQTAPSWVTAWEQGRGEPSEDSFQIEMRQTRVTETEIRNWCTDLENAFLNLEMWSHWISNTCKETISLCEQNASICLAVARKNAMNWNRLKRDINKDALLWENLYQTTENTFKTLKRKYTNVKVTPNKPTYSIVTKAILEAFNEIEKLSLELHQMIVAAEYRALCSCDKRKTR